MIWIEGKRAGQHHCFSCKTGGGLRGLVAHVKDLDLDEAEDWLESLGKDAQPEKRAIRIVEHPSKIGASRFALPREVSIKPLEQWPTLARRYAQERGITFQQVDAYGLGYATTSRLAGRLIFPVRDAQCRPVGYSARTFVDDPVRYLTPSSKENPDQGAIFGEHRWPTLFRRESVVVTEGAIDALAVERSTSLPIAAISGSNLDPGQAFRLVTFPEIIVLTDPDLAGDKVARQIASTLSRHTLVRRVRLPEGKDAATMEPDELAQIIRTQGAAQASEHGP